MYTCVACVYMWVCMWLWMNEVTSVPYWKCHRHVEVRGQHGLVLVYLFNFVWVTSPFVVSWVCLPVYLPSAFSWFACVWLPDHHKSIGIIDVSNTTLDFGGGSFKDRNSGPYIQVPWAIPHLVIMGFVAVFLSSKHFRNLNEAYAKFNNIRSSELGH